MNQNLNPVQRKQKATILTKRDPLNIPNRDTRARDQATIFKAGKKLPFPHNPSQKCPKQNPENAALFYKANNSPDNPFPTSVKGKK